MSIWQEVTAMNWTAVLAGAVVGTMFAIIKAINRLADNHRLGEPQE